MAGSRPTLCLPGPPGPSLRSCFPVSWHPSCTGARAGGGDSSPVQDFAFFFVELHEVHMVSSAHPGVSGTPPSLSARSVRDRVVRRTC